LKFCCFTIVSCGAPAVLLYSPVCPAPEREQMISVQADFDSEARVWYIAKSSLAGLHAEAETIEALVAKLPGLVEDLIELNHVDLHGNVPIELIAHARALAHA
jgi:Domain of unknown function (DUF1902)